MTTGRALRVAFKRWLSRRRLVYEFCHRCGHSVEQVFRVDDAIWATVVGDPHTIRCLACFDEEARACGVWLRWSAAPW